MKFSIVTPTFNSETYIAETIESVISQKGDFEIEYIVADGGSTDGTIDIIQEYERLIKDKSPLIKCNQVTIRWFSEKDGGMYDAINKGFKKATGDICAWVNSNDIYLPGAFEAVQKVFTRFTEVRWLKGITSFINEDSTLVRAGRCYIYDRSWIQKGIYGKDTHFIEQDSVFWRSELWNAAGKMDPALRLAGDFYLWLRFAALTKMYTLRAYVSCFRIHEGQLSGGLDAYFRECDSFFSYEGLLRKWVRFYFRAERLVPLLLRPVAYRLAFGRQDLNIIELRGKDAVLRRKSYYCG